MSYPPIVQSAISKAHWKLLPLLIVMYVMSILDRVNVGFAKAAFQADTGIGDAAFAFGAGIFFIGYALFEIPSNLVLAKVGPRRWLSRIMVSWGVLAGAMMFAHTETSFYVLRFLLGLAEAGFYPGVLLTLTYWFPSRARGQANGILIFGFALSLVIGGPLSGALLETNGLFGLHGWQWMFLIEGLMAVAIGIYALFRLQDRPATAAWLTEAEKTALATVLQDEDAAKAVHAPSQVLKTLMHPKVLYFCLIFLTIQIAAYGLVFYLPTQISQLMGQKVGLKVGLVTSIPWVVAAVATFFITGWSDRYGSRQHFVAALYFLFGVFIIVSAHSGTVVALGALSIAASVYLSGNPLLFTFASEELSGRGIAAGLAMINAVGNLGGFFAPTVKTAVEQYAGSVSAGLDLLGGVAIAAAALVYFIPAQWLAPGRPSTRPGTAATAAE